MGAKIRARCAMERASILLLCALLASSVEGCTAIGFAVGDRADSRAGNGGPELLHRVKMGHRVTLSLLDGRRLEGRFSGWSRDSAATAPATGGLPLREDSVKLAARSGEVTIHAGDIARVSVGVSRGKVTGLLAGATMDALAIAAVAAGLEGMVGSALGK